MSLFSVQTNKQVHIYMFHRELLESSLYAFENNKRRINYPVRHRFLFWHRDLPRRGGGVQSEGRYRQHLPKNVEFYEKYKFRKETNTANYVGHLQPGKHLRWRAKEQNVSEGEHHLGTNPPAIAKGNRAIASLASSPGPSVLIFYTVWNRELNFKNVHTPFSSVPLVRVEKSLLCEQR